MQRGIISQYSTKRRGVKSSEHFRSLQKGSLFYDWPEATTKYQAARMLGAWSLVGQSRLHIRPDDHAGISRPYTREGSTDKFTTST